MFSTDNIRNRLIIPDIQPFLTNNKLANNQTCAAVGRLFYFAAAVVRYSNFAATVGRFAKSAVAVVRPALTTSRSRKSQVC